MTPLTRAAGALAALAAAIAATLSLTAAPALADDCPNAVLRAQNNSTQLPDCRAYEQVTPPFKEGYSPTPTGFTDDGRLTYLTNGNTDNNGLGTASLAGSNMYASVRAGSGWATKGLSPSAPDYDTDTSYAQTGFVKGFSSDLRSSVWMMRRGDETDAVNDLYLQSPDAVFTRIGSSLDPLDPASVSGTFQTSDDLSHVVFSAGSGGTYEYVGTGGGQPRLVSVDNAGQRLASECPTAAGNTYSSFSHPISADGRVIFWSCNTTDPPALYARVNGATTIDASKSQCTRGPSDPGGACDVDSGVLFQGANAGGTRVYFTSSQQLVNGDTDDTKDLYECDIPTGTPAPVGSANPCPDLREVSGAAAGADVQGVTRISDDGSRVYFVATNVLASNTGANDAGAVAGDHNLYVWRRDAAHPAGETRFVAKLDQADGPTNIGGGLWGADALGRPAQATDDGRYLVLATYTQLIDHGPQADTDTARDIYRYDAETGALTRLSIDNDGQGGNEPGQDAQITPIPYHGGTFPPIRRSPRVAMSDDGGSAVFTTDEALVPSDTNGTVDAYLWQEGRVSLISSGKPSGDGGFAGAGDAFGTSFLVQAFISPSGSDVYFTTTAQLLSSDSDQIFDVYDARVDGGFFTPTPTPCAGDACQSPPSTPSPPASPGSTSSPGQAGPPQKTPAFTVGKLTASQLKRIVATGKVSLSVTSNAPGVLSAQATATIAQRPSTVGSAKRAVTKAGTLSLTLTLSKKARAELKSKRKLTVKVLVRQDNVAIARTVSLKLTQPQGAKKTKKRSSRTASRLAAAKGGRS